MKTKEKDALLQEDNPNSKMHPLVAVTAAVCVVILGANIIQQHTPDGVSYIEVPSAAQESCEAVLSENLHALEPTAKSLPAEADEADAPTEPIMPAAEPVPIVEYPENTAAPLPATEAITEKTSRVIAEYAAAITADSPDIIAQDSVDYHEPDSVPPTTAADDSETLSDEEIIEAAPPDIGAAYVLNTNTKKFHLADCSSVNRMSDKNKAYTDDRDYAVSEGYSPCAICNP